MGKRQETSTDEEIVIDSSEPVPPKKHKKHKHKKHKKKRFVEESDETQDLIIDDTPPIRLKMKLATETSTLSSALDKVLIVRDKATPSKHGDKISSTSSSPKIPSKKKKSRSKESGTSSEEERWLDAIESGKLEEVDDELKKIKPKDPKLMTARQRAMFERKSDKDPSPGSELLLALPSGYKEKVMTVEAIQKAALKSQKRKQQADEKREKDKKKTMERLLKKQDSKSGKTNKSRWTRQSFPRVSYRSKADGVTVTFPLGIELPLIGLTQTHRPPPVIKCGVSGCTNRKNYSCSKTGLPLCSLACYKKNLDPKS